METRTIRYLGMLFLLILFITPLASADVRVTPPLMAKQIIGHMNDNYANCKSYRDSGVLKSHIEIHKGKKVVKQENDEIDFTTAFVRPDRFCFQFEYKRSSKQHRFNNGIVWRKGSEVQVWPNLLRLPKSDPFSTGVSIATGMSDGVARMIPAMLMPRELKGWRLTQMTDIKRIENTTPENVDCFRLVGKQVISEGKIHSQWTVWIDKQTFLVRRLEEKSNWQFDGMDFHKENTTTYEAQLDTEISEDKLLFNPPTTTVKPLSR